MDSQPFDRKTFFEKLAQARRRRGDDQREELPDWLQRELCWSEEAATAFDEERLRCCKPEGRET